MERWSRIPEYPQYEVSDLGRVRRVRKVGYRLLKPLIGSNGYRQVCLHANGTGRRVLIHRLVAEAFLGSRPPGADEVNHRNGDKADNSAANLEYATRLQNQRHAAAMGLTARGQRNGAAILSDVTAAEIKGRLRCGWPQVALAARFGVRKAVISRINTGECWQCLEPADGNFDAFVIKGLLAESGKATWHVVGCADTTAEARRQMVAVSGAWQVLRLLHHGNLVDGRDCEAILTAQYALRGPLPTRVCLGNTMAVQVPIGRVYSPFLISHEPLA
jgi:hypothetical protein